MNKSHAQKLIIFVLVGLLFLPLIANAFDFDPVGWVVGGLSGIGKDLADAIMGSIFGLIAGLVAGIPAAALSFLNWVAGPDFLQVSMTNSGLNPGDVGYNGLVGTGWGVTRNLANVALIFGLVAIAINIIMGSQEVQAKKSLVNFILIAILINFTPVICGVILDASNSLTTYFLQEGVRSDLVNFLKEAMADSKSIDIAALIVFFFFGIFSAVIYLLYAVLFACRYIMLWILIILSPIAFATKVFPKSRYITKVFPSFFYWDEWWDQFIQWNVIGIPAGFFIYLSNVAMVEMTTKGYFADASGISVFGRLFTYAMPFIFMAIGFFTTMSSGGAVGAKLSGTAKNIWAKTGGAAAGAGLAAGAAGVGYAAGRAKAAGTYIKEGAIGYGAGALHNIRADEKDKVDWKTREGRDEARQKYREFKQDAKEKAAKYGIISQKTAFGKSASEKAAEEAVKGMDLDYLNRHHQDATMSSEVRKAADIKFMKQNVSDYLKGADTPEEYQRRLKAINTYGDTSKEHKKIKVKALMDASFKNKSKAGTTDWGKLYGDIKIEEEMQKLSPKDLRDTVSEDFLRDENNLSKLSAGQLNYLKNNGSKTQVDAMNEIGKLYVKDKAGRNEARIKTEVKAYKLLLKKARKEQAAKVPGAEENVKKYTAELDKRAILARHFN